MSTALVTGATSGLGAAFATQLAAQGHDLIVVARDQARLTELADRLQAAHHVQVDVTPADLTSDDGCTAVTERLTAARIDILVNNAGCGIYAPFRESRLADEEAMLDLNVRAVLRLTHAAVPLMVARGSGRIINVSSVAGFVPRGHNSTYAASKAWVTLFSEALSVQLHGSGVSVTAVCPGFVHTEFHARADADMSAVPERMWLEADDVVRAALADAAAGKVISVPSARYKALTGIARTLPRPLLRYFLSRSPV